MKRKEIYTKLMIFVSAAVIAGSNGMVTYAAEIGTAATAITSTVGEKIEVEASNTEEALPPSTIRDIFDAEYYAELYPDVTEALGTDFEVLLNHFLTFGLKEGRKCSRLLYVQKYREMYPDLDLAYGDNWDLYVYHYFHFGIVEKRSNGIIKENNVALTRDEDAQEQETYTFRYSDNKGNVIVPWEDVTSGKITLEQLQEKCGDSLIVSADLSGSVTFVGGNLSDSGEKSISDIIDFFYSMSDILNFPEDTAFLEYSTSSKDTLGNVNYVFRAVDEESGQVYSDARIVINVSADGTVQTISTTSDSAYDTALTSNKELDEEAIAKLDAELLADDGLTPVGEPYYAYEERHKAYVWKRLYVDEATGRYYEIGTNVDDMSLGDSVCIYSADYSEHPEDAFPFDFFFKDESGNPIETTEMEFTDASGKTVTLSVAVDPSTEKYYFLDTDRHVVGIENLYKLNAYKDLTSIVYEFSSPSEVSGMFVSALMTIMQTYDVYASLGVYDSPVTTLAGIDIDNTIENAAAMYICGANYIYINNHQSNQAFDAIAHEMTHNVFAQLSGGTLPQYTSGAINEAYADILGNILEMLFYLEAGENYNSDLLSDDDPNGTDRRGFAHEVDVINWLFGEDNDWGKDAAYRSMADPNAYGRAAQIGGLYFLIDGAFIPTESNDNGGVHTNSGILYHVAYQMKKSSGMSMEEIFRIWFDTLAYVNEDSDYVSIMQYVEQSMRNHRYSEEKIAEVNGYFNWAGIYEYKDENGNTIRTDVTSWENITAADGASKVIIKFLNLTENFDMSIINNWMANYYTSLFCSDCNTRVSPDANNVCGSILNEESVVTSIFNIYGRANGEIINGPGITIGDEDIELTIDMTDVAIVARNNTGVWIANEYQNQACLIQIQISDEAKKIVDYLNLYPKEYDGDFAVYQSVYGDSFENENAKEYYLRDNSSYTYIISNMDDEIIEGVQPIITGEDDLALLITLDEQGNLILKKTTWIDHDETDVNGEDVDEGAGDNEEDDVNDDTAVNDTNSMAGRRAAATADEANATTTADDAATMDTPLQEAETADTNTFASGESDTTKSEENVATAENNTAENNAAEDNTADASAVTN